MPLEQGDDRVGIQQESHFKNSRFGRSCSACFSVAAVTKSSSSGPVMASSQRQSCTIGSRITELPWRRIRTSSPSKRKFLGRRTACERPDQKSLAVSMFFEPRDISQKYISRGSLFQSAGSR